MTKKTILQAIVHYHYENITGKVILKPICIYNARQIAIYKYVKSGMKKGFYDWIKQEQLNLNNNEK